MAGFVRRTGKSRYKEYDAAGTIVAGDAVQFDENGEVVTAATAKALVGVAVNGASSSQRCLVDIIDPGSEWEMPVGTGTMVAAEIGEEADLADENQLTLTESNNDVLITGWDGVSTDKCYGIFKKLAFGETVAA